MRCKKCFKTFRHPPQDMRKTQICGNCKNNVVENMDSEIIEINTEQIKVIKKIAEIISNKELSEFSLKDALKNRPYLQYFINRNWGTIEHFIKLALDHKKLNQISLMLYFLNIVNAITKVPTKEEMKQISKFSMNEFESRFVTWERFLEILGFITWNKTTTESLKLKNDEKISKNASQHIFKEIKNVNERFTESQRLMDEILLDRNELQGMFLKLKEKLKQIDLYTIREFSRKI